MSEVCKYVPGVRKFMTRAEQGESLTVVFFGGSLTWGANASDPNLTSWRGRTMSMLKQRYPEAKWSFFDAAIGGTCSDLGVLRMEQDVFRHKPDLVFLDFTLNDGLDGDDQMRQNTRNGSYETIVRQCLARDVIVMPVFLTSRSCVVAPDLSRLKRRLSHMEMCRYYNLDWADVLGIMNAAYFRGELDVEPLWPKELFDTCHPCDDGYAAYTDAFCQEWQRIADSEPTDAEFKKEWFYPACYRNVAAYIPEPDNIPDGWYWDLPYVMADTFDWLTSRHYADVMVCGGAHTAVFSYEKTKPVPAEFTVTGENIYITMEIVKQTSFIEAEVDGERKTIPFRPSMISSLQYQPVALGLDPEKEHSLRIIVPELEGETPNVVRITGVFVTASGPCRITRK